MTTLTNHSDAQTLDHASEPGACDLCRSLMRGDLDGENIDVRNHHACSPCSDDILRREAEGRASCTFDDGAWTWHEIQRPGQHAA